MVACGPRRASKASDPEDCRIIGTALSEGAEGGGMLEKTYNEIVSSIQATTADEVAQVLARLPDIVRVGLSEEVQKFSDGHRYDEKAKRAYYFERQGTGLGIWSWNHIYRPHEAGELIFRVVSARTLLDERLANECYERATGRSVTNLQSLPTDETEN